MKVLFGTKAKRLKALRDLDAAPASCLRVAVINYESIWREEIFDSLLGWDPDMIICDESQHMYIYPPYRKKYGGH